MSFAKSKQGDVFLTPLVRTNPVMIQTLGVCSALAVTAQIKPALVMSLAMTAVLTISNIILSMMRHYIPGKIRIITYMVVIASLVIVADQLLKTYLFDVSKQLSVFVGLIITNCIVMGRAEAFAMSNSPNLSMWDGLGNGLGYSLVLVSVAIVRELFGAGKLLGIQIIPQFAYDELGYTNNGLLLLAPGAFFLLGTLIWVTYGFGKKG